MSVRAQWVLLFGFYTGLIGATLGAALVGLLQGNPGWVWFVPATVGFSLMAAHAWTNATKS